MARGQHLGEGGEGPSSQRLLTSSLAYLGYLKYLCPACAFKLKPVKERVSFSSHIYNSQVPMGKPPEVTSGPIDLGAIYSLYNLPLWAPTLPISVVN